MQTQTDIEFLVQETLELANSMAMEDAKLNLENVPHAMGILFRIEKKMSYSLIRCVFSENIYSDLEALMGGSEVLSEEASHLKWFETSSQYQADFIISQFANRRINHGTDDLVDPDQDSWWLAHQDCEFIISPRNFFTQIQSGIYKLGPLGDFGLARANFDKFCQIFRGESGLVSLKTEKNKVLITTSKQSVIFNFLEKLLVEGLETPLVWNEESVSEYEKVARQGLKTYFSEIGILRKFQIEVEKATQTQVVLN